MGRRENFKKTLRHEQPDDLVLDLGGCPLSTMMGKSYESLAAYLDIVVPPQTEILKWGQVHQLEERLLEHLDIDTRAVGSVQIPLRSQYKVLSPNSYTDEWGIKRVFTGLYWDITESPLQNKTVDDLKDFNWPDPASMDLALLKREQERAKWLYENTDYVICADLPVYGVFELGCWICGFEDYLYKLAVDEDFIHEFSRRVLDYQKKVSEIYYSYLGKYIHYTASGDDFATQTNTFMSVGMFREMIMPYFKARVAHTKQHTDAAFLHHSCGNVYTLIPSLIECGVDILNPIHPTTPEMSARSLKKDYGSNIVFHGGFDTQTQIFGTPQQIDTAVKQLCQNMHGGGGYIFACAHNIQEDVAPQNIVTLFEAARKYGKQGGWV